MTSSSMTRQLLAEGVWIYGRSSETSQLSTDGGRERGPGCICIDRNGQDEDRKEEQTDPLRIRHRGKRPVNLIGKSF